MSSGYANRAFSPLRAAHNWSAVPCLLLQIASFVNKSSMDSSILQRSLAILESMVLNSHDLYQKVAQEITIGQLIPHLQG